jgi:hypothetical protein
VVQEYAFHRCVICHSIVWFPIIANAQTVSECIFNAMAIAKAINAKMPEMIPEKPLSSPGALFELDGHNATLYYTCNPLSVEVHWQKKTCSLLMAKILSKAGNAITSESATKIDTKLKQCISSASKHFIRNETDYELTTSVGKAYITCAIGKDRTSSANVRIVFP